MNIVGETKDSVLWRHCRLDHDSEIQNFTIKVTGMYRRDAMLRQVSEAVALGNAKVGTRVELCSTAESCNRQWRRLNFWNAVISSSSSLGPSVSASQ